VCVDIQFDSKPIRRAAIGLVFLLACSFLQAQMPNLPGGLTPAPAKPALPDGAARVLSQSGSVSIVRNGDLWVLQQGAIVQAGTEIVSETDGHAILELSDTSRVEVFPNSRLIFRANHGNWKDLLDLVLGKVRVHIEKLGGQPNPYRMNSPTALIAVRGTTFEVNVDASETTTVYVEEGLVAVRHRRHPTKDVEVSPGETLTVYANEPIAQSQVDKVRTAARIVAGVAERTAEIIRQVGGIGRTAGSPGGGTTTGTVPTGTTSTPSTTPVGSTSGSGTTTPPSNGRGGTGSNGDTTTPSPTGPTTGGTTTPITTTPVTTVPGTSTGTGSTGAPPSNGRPSSGPASMPRKPQ
jgi:hypothetical protein